MVALFFLYLKDINDCLEARAQAKRQAQAGGSASPMASNMHATGAGYARLDESEEKDDEALLEMESVEVRTAAELTRELRVTSDTCEELEVREQRLTHGAQPS